MSDVNTIEAFFGAVRFFDVERRFGFIEVKEGPEVFFHISDGRVLVAEQATRQVCFNRDTPVMRDPKVGDEIVFLPTMGHGRAAIKAKPWGFADEYGVAINIVEPEMKPVVKPVNAMREQATWFVESLMRQTESWWYDAYVKTLRLSKDQLIARELASRELQSALHLLDGDKQCDQLNILMRARIPLDLIVEVLKHKCELSLSMYTAIHKGYASILPPELLCALEERIEQTKQVMYLFLNLCEQGPTPNMTPVVGNLALEARFYLENTGCYEDRIPCPHGGYYKEDLCPDCQNGDM